MSDNEIIREVIEIFLVHYFSNIEMSGTVLQEKRNDVNYFSIDLNNLKWDEDLEKLHGELVKYLSNWTKQAGKYLKSYIDIATLTITYLLPEKDGENKNQYKLIRLFYLPSYFFESGEGRKQIPRNKFVIWLLNVWYNILLRNFLIVSTIVITLIILNIYKSNSDATFADRLAKSFEYVNVASSIIASFVLGYLINKVLSIRQDKLRRIEDIKNLSNKLTYFRNICYNLSRDHNYWSGYSQYNDAFKYGYSIKDIISFEDYYYPNYDDNIEYAKFRAVFNDKVSNAIVTLVLELEMMAGESFLKSGLSYTKYPANYIYSFEEMKKFAIFCDINQIWYCCSEGNYFPDTFPLTYGIQEVLNDFKRIDRKQEGKYLTKEMLETLSLDFQYDIIPRLYHLTKTNEADLPLTVKYLRLAFTLVLLFGIILPSLCYLFICNKIYAFSSVYIVIAVISHILLSLNAILRTENSLDRKEDYIS